MRKTFNLPQYIPVNYTYNPQTYFYLKNEFQEHKGRVLPLPDELRVERTRAEQIKRNAEVVIVSRYNTEGLGYQFISGLQKTEFLGWYLGNEKRLTNKGNEVISLILFHFSENSIRLTAYYFKRFNKRSPKLRMQFVRNAVSLLNTKGRLEPPLNEFNLAIQSGDPVRNYENKNNH